jgi:hypothetical protein
MGGTATSRGINFQYASAIGFLIEFATHPEWHVIQLEGDLDIEDVRVEDQSGRVVCRAQIKQKEDPHQWTPSEIRDVLLELAQTPDTADTVYQFIYAGSEGPKLNRELKPILLKLQFEGKDSLSQQELDVLSGMLGDEVASFLQRVAGRMAVLQKGNWESIEATDLRRIRRLVPKDHPLRETDDFEQDIYNSLFIKVARSSQQQSKYFRRLTKHEVYQLLLFTEARSPRNHLELSTYIQSIKQIAMTHSHIIPLMLQETSASPVILSYLTKVKSDSELSPSSDFLPLHTVVEQAKQLVIAADSGSGKTISLWQLVLHYCEKFEHIDSHEFGLFSIPIFIDLSRYNGETISELIRDSIANTGQKTSLEAISDLADRGQLTLLCDDFHVIKSDYARESLYQLKDWLGKYPKCLVVMTTQRPTDGHKLRLPTWRILPLDTKQGEEILLTLPDVSKKDAWAILESLPQESRHLTTSPLTLHMLAYVYMHSDRQFPRTRSLLYKQVVNAILMLSEQKGFFEIDRSDKERLLALLARWMQENEQNSVSPSVVSSLIDSWMQDKDNTYYINHLQSYDALSIRNELAQTGLLQYSLDGEFQFIHPTFRSYFAAITLDSSDLLKFLDNPIWTTTILFWSSITNKANTDTLIELLADHPLLLGRVIIEQADQRGEVVLNVQERISYIENFSYFFRTFVKHFPSLLWGQPWKLLLEDRLKVRISQNDSGYILEWQPMERDKTQIDWAINDKQVHKGNEHTFPSPIWIIPLNVIHKYHPLELAYLWIMGMLYEVLAFGGWRGGIDVTKTTGDGKVHLGVALVTNRFLLYNEFAKGLPQSVQDQLPFYGSREYDIGIEVDERIRPPTVQFAVMTGKHQEQITLTQSILREDSDDLPLFFENEDGDWVFKTDDTVREISTVDQISLSELLVQPPGVFTTRMLLTDLERILPGFPPQLWV